MSLNIKPIRGGGADDADDIEADNMDRVRNLTASQLKTRLIQIVHNKGIFNSMKVFICLKPI